MSGCSRDPQILFLRVPPPKGHVRDATTGSLPVEQGEGLPHQHEASAEMQGPRGLSKADLERTAESVTKPARIPRSPSASHPA